ncbi:MAG: hypothetical protein ACR2NU_08690 [Aeoliella sp.]
MNTQLHRSTHLWTIGFVVALTTTANAGNACLHPAIKHTNGMRIASSEPHRASSVEWQCNPDKLGYCGGVYYLPCIDSIRCSNIRRARHGCYSHSCGHYRSSACGVERFEVAGDRFEGVEPAGMAELGQLSNDLVGIGLGVAAPPRAGR